MTVEPNWRIEYGSPGGGEDVAESQLDAYLEVEALKKAGVLIPDTRLQAIAAAASESFMWCFTHGQKRLQCEWAKKLYECSDVDDAVIVRASLLDVLAEEEQ